MIKIKKKDLFTIPNIMCYIRLALIPVFCLLYCTASSTKEYYVAAAVVLVATITDFLDGFVARKFHMITELGKMLDPIADKIMHLAIVICLTIRYPFMLLLLLIMVAKECYMGIMGIRNIRRGNKIEGAMWYGKICTASLFISLIILIFVPVCPVWVVNSLILINCVIMVFTWFMYKCKVHKISKIKWTIIFVLIGALSYVLIGACLPYMEFKDISQSTKDSFQRSDYYSAAIGPDRARVVDDNQEAMNIRLQMIMHAQKKIVLSTFDFRSDEAGKDVLAALQDAANRGVQVEIFVDGSNSLMRMERNDYFYALSSNPKVKIKIYNPISILKPWTAMARMHDKYVIIDDEAYVVGGRNTYGYFLGSYAGIKNYDRDVLVYNSGSNQSSIYQLKQYYEEISNLACCSLFHQDEVLQTEENVKEKVKELTKRFEGIQKKHPKWINEKYDYARMTVPCNKVTLIVNPVENAPKAPVAFYKLMKLCQGAKKQVVIHTPYVICNRFMYEQLSKIGPKGIVMLNSAQNNGNLFGTVDYIRNKQKLIDTNLEVHEYEGKNSYHGKSITIDDDMAIIGSFNMDMRSAYIDTEIMVAIHSKEVFTQLNAAMDHYDQSAAVVETKDTYRNIPKGMKMQSLSTAKKTINGAFGWIFDGLRYLM